ncbi:MAG: hypothetical protein ACRDRI_03240 [Pseudonocardiaceae bacterium]
MHAGRYKGIGDRLLDGRQVAILARCTAGDCDGAIDMLAGSSTPSQWEKAVAACLTVLCLRMGDQPVGSYVDAMVSEYLKIGPTQGRLVFRIRLGLCVVDLAADARGVGVSQVVARVIREALAAADAYAAEDVLSHETCHSRMTEADEGALAEVVALAGLRRGTMPAEFLDDLMVSVRTSETWLAQVLAHDSHRHGGGPE